MLDLAEFTAHELRMLLGCQEYPEGTFATERIDAVYSSSEGRR